MFRGLLLLLSVLALTAPVAAAQEDEVFIDPGSPSGKEYALPVDSARKQASTQKQKSGTASRPAPLFGEGVEPDAAAQRSAGGSASGTGDDRGAAGGTRKAGDASRADAPRSSRAGAGAGTATLRAQAASPDGGSGLVAIIGVGAGALLLGGAIGLLLRRRSARAA